MFNYIPNQITSKKMRKPMKSKEPKIKQPKHVKQAPTSRPIYIYINDHSNHPRFSIYFDMS